MDERQIIKDCIKACSGGVVVQGPGDDCSVVDYDESRYLIASSDCLIEGIHFRLQDLSPQELAYKALAVNISDISAMGGEPFGVHLTLGLPKAVDQTFVKAFFKTFYEISKSHNILVLGGDLSGSPQSLFINVHVSGFVNKKSIQWRREFAKADVLCVTGPLGDSAAGLHGILNDQKVEVLEKKHLAPPILTKEAQWLSEQESVSGMMDLSDGLLKDLSTLPEVGYDIELSSLPLSQELKAYCDFYSLDPYQFSLAGGEDYELLFGCKQELLDSLQASYKNKFNKIIFPVGVINTPSKSIRILQEGEEVSKIYKPFEHF